MTTRLSKSRAGRSGFTLVELLVAITVIAILVGMLSAAVIPALTSAKRFTIVNQMKQMELGLEQFKNDYGFYPPSWISITNDGANTAAQSATRLQRYLNRIAPNNLEGAGAVGSRPVDAWWTAVGQHIEPDHGDDLVFWLSALSKNAQYPLTNDGLAAAGADIDGDGVLDDAAFNNGQTGFERVVFYEFPTNQLYIHDGITAHFLQQAGVEAPWVYIDAGSYGIGALYDGYHVLNTMGASPVKVYENPNTYQLVCPGLDKEIGPSVQWAEQVAPGYEGLINFVDQGNGIAGTLASDNICNFCEGELSLLTEGSRDSQAVKY